MQAERLNYKNRKQRAPLFDVRWSTAIVLMIGMLLFAIGCEIEETTPPQTGSVNVTLADDALNPIIGAAIRIDDQETARITPARIAGIPVGAHRISVFKPGYLDTSATVTIVTDQTVAAELTTIIADAGSINLVDAPNGTVLLMNNIPVGTVPTDQIPPTLFTGLGLGTFSISAYLPGSATEFPAPWTINLENNPVDISPVFTPLNDGYAPGNLAPTFELPSDWDSSLYRLQDYRGRVVLVTFFFANCTACIEEFPHFQEVYSDPAYRGKLQFLGVDDIDPYSIFKEFRDDHPSLGLTFPLLHDRSQTLRLAYGVTSNPANFLIDQSGRVRMARGSISEPELRQQIENLIGTSTTETFSFSMLQTVVPITDPNSTYEFHGVVTNKLAAPRTFVFELNPIGFPDTSRQTSICAQDWCNRPASGSMSVTSQYSPMLVDSAVRFSVYNVVTDWQSEPPVPVESPIVGDQIMDVSVYPVDNPTEIVSYRLTLEDPAAGPFVRGRSGGLKTIGIESRFTSR